MNHVNHYVERALADGTCIITPRLNPEKPGVIEEITFALNDEVKNEIESAKKFHNDKFAALQCTVAVKGVAPAVQNPYYYDQDAEETKKIFKAELNRAWMQKRKIGPDGFVQLSILIAGRVVKGFKIPQIKKAQLIININYQ